MARDNLPKRLRDAVQAKKKATEDERAVIVEALDPDSGMKQAEVSRVTGYSREHLRRIARENNIPPAR